MIIDQYLHGVAKRIQVPIEQRGSIHDHMQNDQRQNRQGLLVPDLERHAILTFVSLVSSLHEQVRRSIRGKK